MAQASWEPTYVGTTSGKEDTRRNLGSHREMPLTKEAKILCPRVGGENRNCHGQL